MKSDIKDPLNLPSINGTDESVRGSAAAAVIVHLYTRIHKSVYIYIYVCVCVRVILS